MASESVFNCAYRLPRHLKVSKMYLSKRHLLTFAPSFSAEWSSCSGCKKELAGFSSPCCCGSCSARLLLFPRGIWRSLPASAAEMLCIPRASAAGHQPSCRAPLPVSQPSPARWTLVPAGGLCPGNLSKPRGCFQHPDLTWFCCSASWIDEFLPPGSPTVCPSLVNIH